MASAPKPLPRISATEFIKRRQWGENNINAGRLREFPYISVDKFYGEHLQATIFILTHCHTDHMVGLDEEEFWNRLQEPGVKLYLHKITPALLSLFERPIRGKDGIEFLMGQNKLVPLEVCIPNCIVEPFTGTELTLTFLPAGHCPGSVMLQFEYDDHCILYTGDCRVEVSDLEKNDSLHTRKRNSKGGMEKKTITHLYIDTTFCSSRSQDFPGRSDAVEELLQIVENWLGRNPHNCVNLKFAARFSHEYVLQRFYEKFRIQAHVNQERYTAYQEIPQLLRAVTLNPNTKFHFCHNDSVCLINCRSGTSGEVLNIKLSSLWFMKNQNGTGPENAVKLNEKKKIVTICYSMHSSLDEIADIIDYLEPKVVTPLVLPKHMDRRKLESELRRSTKGDFIYEDYIYGLRSPTVLKVKEAPAAVLAPVSGSTRIVTSVNRPATPQSTERERKKNIKWDSPSPPSSPIH